MTFITPLWLLGLLAWSAIVVWLMTGRRDRAVVPFLELWKSREPAPPLVRQRAIRLPPWALISAILSMLLAILAAARPRINAVPYTQGPPITIILDRGLSMTAGVPSQPRWKQTAQLLRHPLQSRLGLGATRLVLLPEDRVIEADRPSWMAYASMSNPPPADTTTIFESVLQREYARDDGLIFVVTDQKLPITDPRVVHISPLGKVDNIGIVSAGASTLPRPAVMVRLRNDSDRKGVQLRVGDLAPRWVDLPARGEETNYFFDLDQLSDSIEIALASDDEQPLDNGAKLTRRQAWPTIDSQGDLPAEVRRMIQTYSKRRPSSDHSAIVTVTADPSVTSPAVIIAPAKDPLAPSPLTLVDHPVIANVDWQQSLIGATSATAPAGNGWKPIVSMGEQAVLAIRENPARQVWIGFNAPDFARRSDFVIFWTNALDWVSRGSDQFTFEGTSAVPMLNWPDPTWPATIKDLPRYRRGGADIAPFLLIVALCLLVLSALTWK